jgi:hypothetical protein
MSDIIRELREDYPAVDVTTVVFSRDFASVGCCVIPQDRVLAIIGDIEALVRALEAILEIDPHGFAIAPMPHLVRKQAQSALDAVGVPWQ